MGDTIGHPPRRAGRPVGSKDSKPRKRIQGTEDIRLALAEAFRKQQPVIFNRVFAELSTLEGYAYLSGVQILLKQILPALQSIELTGTMEEKKSVLLEHINSLKQDFNNKT